MPLIRCNERKFVNLHDHINPRIVIDSSNRGLIKMLKRIIVFVVSYFVIVALVLVFNTTTSSSV